MENNNKTNDMFLAVVRNPTANTYDFLDNGINPVNTQLKDKDFYKDKEVITSQFIDEEGKFNEESFNKAYQLALFNYNQLSNEEALKNLQDVKYNPFDTTRPVGTKKWDVDIKYSTDYNPYRELYSRDYVNSITESKLSLKEIAQKGGVHDLKTNTWEKSVNTWNIFKKAFGDTVVYAQWDEDGVHSDPETGQLVKHRKGDWKVNDKGSLYLEKLGDREIYGKQVVAFTDILTADGSFWNKYDPFDSDGREKSAAKVAAKTIIEIAPLLIPGVQTYYAGVRASVGLISVLPTFYKGLESLLLGDKKSFLTDPVTKFEGWMSKHNTHTSSDKGSQSMWNFEQMGQMVTDIFAQIYEQRAMASLSKHLVKTEQLMDKRMMELQGQVLGKANLAAKKYGIDASKAIDRAIKDLPELQKAIEKQSQLSKAFSLGYMALTSTGDIYGEALESGFDRRTAGFAALLTASGQYGIMMNNRMGDWFLDKSTGYTMETNKALMKRSIKPYIKEIDKILTDSGLSKEAQKAKLASLTTSFKKTLNRTFKDYTIVGENMWKNSIIEGVEEVTEQVVEDMTKGVVDLLSYFGITKGKGSFDTVGRYTSSEAYNEYLANFVGGVLGGGLFELERSVIAPALNPKLRAQNVMSPELNQSIYEMVAGGHKDLLIDMIKKESKLLADNNLSYLQEDGEFLPGETISQSDLVAQKAIEIIDQLESVFLSEGLVMTDEEIVNKAIRDQIMITEFEKNQEEGSLLGLEAIALKDFKETALQIANVKNSIIELEKEQNQGKDVEAQIKNEKEKLKELTSKTNSILKGENAMHYFNQLSFALVDAISSKYGSFDRDTYLQTVYGKSYEDFPEKGILTKQMVNKEWEDFLDSSDLKKKLEVATGAFLHYESLINPIIANYVGSGYSQERIKTYELLIDLKRTTELFKLEDNPENKNKLITNFINIMNSLESQGVVKFGTWDVYKTNVFEKFMENNMFKKVNYDTDENGNTVKTYEDITEDFLNAKNSNGVTNREQMEDFVNTIAAHFPAQAFDTKEMIKSFNEASQNRGSEIFNTYNTLKNKENKTQEDLDALTLMENDLFSIELQTLNNLPVIKELNTKAGEEMIVSAEKYFPEIFNENLEQHEKIQKVAMEKRRHKMFMDNKARYSKTFEDVAKEVLGDNYKENFDDYTDDEIIAITNKFNELGLTHEAALKLDNVDEIAAMHEEIKANDSIINTEQREVFRTIFEAINDVISEANQIINNENFQKYNNEIQLIEDKLKSDIEQATPEIMKLQDMAYDVILKTLESGVIDKEIYDLGKEMMNNLINSEIAKSFKNPDNVTLENVLKFIENVNQIETTYKNLDLEQLEIKFPIINDITQEQEIDLETGRELWEYEIDIEEFDSNLNPQNFINLMDAIAYNNMNMLPESIKDKFTSEYLLQLNERFNNITNLTDWNNYKSFILATADFQIVFENFNATIILNDLMTSNTLKNIQEIQNKFDNIASDEGKYISNPFYDWLRNHFVTLDSGEKALTVLDILQREQTAYNASTGASNYISEGVRPQDIMQVKKLLELLKVNVMAASQTDLLDHSLGFIKMRQDFATRNKLQDDVLNLKTISSEEGHTLTKDIDRLITKLDFLLGLSTFNSKRQATEQKEIGLKVQQILIDSWDSIINNDIGNNFIPREEVIEILNSNEENSQKLLKIEDVVYDKNKSNKNEALKSLLSHFENISYSGQSKYSKDMTAADMTELDIVNYLATALSVKSSEYLKYKYNNLKTDNKAPFYMQEMVAKQIYARIINPLLFEEVFKSKIDKSKDDASYVTIVLGAAGSGKTTAIMGPVLDIIRQSNKESDIWLSAPNKSQVNKLESAIKSSVGEDGIKFNNLDKRELFSKFGEKVFEFYEKMQDFLNAGKFEKGDTDALAYINDQNYLSVNIPQELMDTIDFSSLPNLLIIDEITHFSNPEIQLLSMISKASLQSNSGNYMNVVGLGDQNQLGYHVPYNDTRINFNIEGLAAVFTPMLQSSIRSSNDQQRINNDILLNLVSNSIARSRNVDSQDEMNLKVQTYLQDVNTETGLKYYLTNEDFKGIYVHDSNILEPLKAIAHTKKTKPETKVGILTENNEIPESIKKYLDLVGLSEEDLEIFTPLNVQGSEVDYFIFGTLDIFKWGKYRDNLKALYTYASRSTEGSVILDYDGKLKSLLNISNADASNNYQQYDPLNKSVVDELIQERVEEIENLLENSFGLKEDTFKWIRNVDGKTSKSLDLAFGVIPNGNLFVEGVENGSEITQSQKKALQKANVKIDDFKIMLHSFYNSPGAELQRDSNGEIIKIITNDENPNTDLNGWGNPISDVNKVIDQWVDLKYQLLFKKGKFDTLEYKDYLSHIFNDNFDNSISSSNIQIEYLMTAQRYKAELHDPYAKQERDEEKQLKSSDVFINLTAKLTIKGRSHFITLATFPKLDTILNQGLKYVKGSEEEINRLTSQITDFYDKVDTIPVDSNELYNLGKIDLDNYQFITGTRMVSADPKKKPKHYLTNLKRDFPGLHYSEMRLFPGNFTDFKNLLDKYEFGEKRGEKKTEDLFKMMKNKPYIVVSFESKQSLEGSVSGDSQAKLLPIGSSYRNMDVLITEILNLKDEVNTAIAEHYEWSDDNYIPSPVINAKFETLLNATQILDILIKWGKTSTELIKDGDGNNLTLLDLLTQSLDIKNPTSLFNSNTKILDVLSNFKGSESKTNNRLEYVIYTIKSELQNENNTDDDVLKKSIIGKIRKMTGWNWNFYNLFNYSNIIDSKFDKQTIELFKKGFYEEGLNIDSLGDEDANKLKSWISTLLNTIKDEKFYYSIPLSLTDRSEVRVNSYVGGDTGFKKEFFGDKFYISGSPEGPRMLLDFNKIINPEIIDIHQNSEKSSSELEPEQEQEQEQQEESGTSEELIDSPEMVTDLTKVKINSSRNKVLTPFINEKNISAEVILTNFIINASENQLSVDQKATLLGMEGALEEDINTTYIENIREDVNNAFEELKNALSYAKDRKNTMPFTEGVERKTTKQIIKDLFDNLYSFAPDITGYYQIEGLDSLDNLIYAYALTNDDDIYSPGAISNVNAQYGEALNYVKKLMNDLQQCN